MNINVVVAAGALITGVSLLFRTPLLPSLTNDNPFAWLTAIAALMLAVVAFGGVFRPYRSALDIIRAILTSVIIAFVAIVVGIGLQHVKSALGILAILLGVSFVLGAVARSTGRSRHLGFRDYATELVGLWSAIVLFFSAALLFLGLGGFEPVVAAGLTPQNSLALAGKFAGLSTIFVSAFIMPVAVGTAVGFYSVGFAMFALALPRKVRVGLRARRISRIRSSQQLVT